LFDGYIDTDRDRKAPGDQKGQEGNEEGHAHTAQQYIIDRPLPEKRIAKIQMCDDIANPAEILHIHRPVKTVHIGQSLNFGCVHRCASGLQTVNLLCQEIPRRQLDDNESQDGNQENLRDHPCQASNDVVQHKGLTS
jgi:hypothetical protein